MKFKHALSKIFLLAFGFSNLENAAHAQDVPTPVIGEATIPTTEGQCELRVRPTTDPYVQQQGVLSAFLFVGFIIDEERHKNANERVAALITEYLPPEAQVEILLKAGLLEAFGADRYRLIVDPPYPKQAEEKKDTTLKKERKARWARHKAGIRNPFSSKTCVIEIYISLQYSSYIESLKKIKLSSTYFGFRDFGSEEICNLDIGFNPVAVYESTQHFPPTSEEMVPLAKAELQDRFLKQSQQFLKELRDYLSKGRVVGSMQVRKCGR